jgi:hypothetical protein
MSYKAAMRPVNAHALLNAAFQVNVDEKNGTIREAAIVYGGVQPWYGFVLVTSYHMTGLF